MQGDESRVELGIKQNHLESPRKQHLTRTTSGKKAWLKEASEQPSGQYSGYANSRQTRSIALKTSMLFVSEEG